MVTFHLYVCMLNSLFVFTQEQHLIHFTSLLKLSIVPWSWTFIPFVNFLIYFITFSFFLLTSSLCFCQPFPLLFPLLFSSTSFPYLFFLDSNVPPNHPPFHTHLTHQPPECPPNNICPFVALSKQIKNLWPFTSSLVCLYFFFRFFFFFQKKIGNNI